MSSFNVLTMEDIYQERLPRRYITQGINEMPSVNILYGTPTTMKSMLLADKVHCILNGIPWLGNSVGAPVVNTKMTGVLWVDFDNGKRRTLDRLAAIGRHYRTSKNAPLYVVSCPAEGLNMGDPSSVLRLKSTITSDVGYVVVDNLGYVSGGADENTTQMVPVMGAFRTLAEQTGVAFEIIHHERKGSSSSGDRVGDKIRGSSSIEGSLDRAFRVTRNPGEDLVTIFSVKERDQPVRPMSARFNCVQDSHGELKEAWFTGEDADTVEFRIKKAVLEFAGFDGHNQSAVVKHVQEKFEEEKVGRPKATKALEDLVVSGKLIKEQGRGTEILYKRPGGPDKFTDVVHYNQEILPTHGVREVES